MGDRPRSRTTDFYSILGISTSASIKDMCRAYKSLVKKWHPDRNPSNKAEAEAKFQEINEAYKALNEEKINGKLKRNDETTASSPEGSNHHKNMDEGFFLLPTALLKSLSRKSQSLTLSPTGLLKSGSRRSISPSPSDLTRSASRRSTSPTTNISGSKSASGRSASVAEISSLSRSMSRRSPTTPIVFSQSTPRKKPQPIEKRLECTLEDLFHGCVKKIKITRDVIKDGIIEQEEEIVKIKINPGWTKGTKITFEGKGDERPGYLPADIIFLIDEEQHPLFERVGDDLEYTVEISLAEALTGCTISVPLLAGGKMSLSFDEVIHPRYEKIIRGQGMPITKEEGKRGDLRIKFHIYFPIELSHEQRSNALSILQDCC